MTKTNIGKFSFNLDDCGHRDAVHAPVVLVHSDDVLNPGDNVRFLTNKKVYKAASKHSSHGIVDPFLSGHVERGVCFLVWLKPDSTLNLQHHFDLTFENEIESVDVQTSIEEEKYLLEQKVKDLEYKLKEEQRRSQMLEDENLGYNDSGCRGCY